MARAKSVYVCSACGGQSAQWMGRCPQCEAWNTLVETAAESGPRPGVRSGGRSHQGLAPGSAVQDLSAVQGEARSSMPSSIAELDRVLGGGLVAGSVVLIGGDPGIGKSTLLLQVLSALAAAHRVLYVSGEESAAQIGLRAQRLGLQQSDVRLLAEIQLDRKSVV